MAKRNLTDTERLGVAVNLLEERALEQYPERCEKLEETPPLWVAGVCPACGGEYRHAVLVGLYIIETFTVVAGEGAVNICILHRIAAVIVNSYRYLAVLITLATVDHTTGYGFDMHIRRSAACVSCSIGWTRSGTYIRRSC